MGVDEGRRGRTGLAGIVGLFLLATVLGGCGSGSAPAEAGPGPTDSPGEAVTAGTAPLTATSVMVSTGATSDTGQAAGVPVDGAGPSPTGPPVQVGPSQSIGQSAPSGPAASSAAAPSAQPTGRELEALLARQYEAYWDAFDAARQSPTATPQADFPALAALAAGDQLDLSFQAVSDMAQAGEAIREPATPSAGGTDAATEHRVRIDRVEGTVAELSACVVNDDIRYVVAGGAIVRDGVTTVRSSATMAITDGQWKLIRSQAVEISDGLSGCWLESGAYPW